uniref:Protein HTATIP2 n=2 Tax=Schistosoma japonicum TaxID=6182 RepID=C1L6E7_SCHJA|nr:Oxidoreductase HTATIP2 [Schistosoma japonicum]
MVNLRAFVVGSTGETGKALIKALAKDPRYSSIKLIQRRKTEVDYGLDDNDAKNRFTQITIDFDRLDEHQEVFQNTDVGFCALVTTLRKSGREKMRIIDHDYVIRVAELCSAAGCQAFHLVSSKGANKMSMIFYLKLKGEIESDLISLNLFPKCLAIYRPGTLLCSRIESRPAERVFQILLKPLSYLTPTLLTTPVDVLADAMAHAPFSSKLNADSSTQHDKSLPKNVHIFENHDIFALAASDDKTT